MSQLLPFEIKKLQAPVAAVSLSWQSSLITPSFIEQLEEALATLLDDYSQWPLIISGSGNFCGGFDFDSFGSDTRDFRRFERVLQKLRSYPAPTLASISGSCWGSGLSLALSCDLRLTTPGASWAFNEVKQGRVPGSAAWLLPKFVSFSLARRMLLEGLVLDGRQACQSGLVEHCQDNLEEVLQQVLQSLATTPNTAYCLSRRLLEEATWASFDNWQGSYLAAQARCQSGCANE